MAYDAQRIRIEAETTKVFDQSLKNVTTGEPPRLYAGNTVDIEISLFDEGSLVDVSDLATAVFELKPVNADGTPPDDSDPSLMNQTVATFDNTNTIGTWISGLRQHIKFEFTSAQTKVTPGDHWASCYVTTSGGDTIVIFAGPFSVDKPGTDLGTPTNIELGESYYTSSASDTRFVHQVGAETITGSLDVDNIKIDGNAITSTDTDGDITITPNGTGDIVLDGLKWPQADGTADYVLKTDGAGQLSWTEAALSGSNAWSDAVDSDIIPDADGTRDLGSTGTRFAEIYTDTIDITNNITVGGTVDGRDIATDGTKLDGIESSATADQTAGEIKTAYESNADTNAFTDADHTKLDSVETNADVTDETSVKAALDGATISSATVASGDKVIVQDIDDSDNLKTVTAQSIANLAIGSGDSWGDAVDADIVPDANNTRDLGSSGNYFASAYVYNLYLAGNVTLSSTTLINGNGHVRLTPASTYDVFLGNMRFDADQTIGAGQDDYVLTYDHTSGTIRLEAAAGAGGGDAWGDAVDASIVPDTDSTYTLGSGTNYFSDAYIDTITTTGNITVGGTVDGRDIAADGTKLDGIEAAADVTDATNVDAAGAVMNSDTSTASMSFVIDEDDMTSDSATKVPTQQSVKAYVDSAGGGGGGSWEYISTGTASSSASISFTGLSSTYFAYRIIVSDYIPATDNSSIYLRSSTDNGSSYDSGSTDYDYNYSRGLGGSFGGGSSTGAAQMLIADSISNVGGNEANSLIIDIIDHSSAKNTHFIWTCNGHTGDGSSRFYHGGGSRKAAADVDAIQILSSSGNITSGNFKLYGIKAT